MLAKIKFYRLVILVEIIILLSGCTRLVVKTEYREEGFLINQRISQIEKYNNSIGYFYGKALVIYRKKQSGEEKVYSFRAQVYRNPENYIRINISDFLLNRPLVSMSIMTGKVRIVDHVKRRLIEKNIDEFDTSSFLKLHIPVDFFTNSIIGRIYVINSPTKFTGSPGSLEISDLEKKEVIYFDSGSLPTKIELSAGEDQITVNFEKRNEGYNRIPEKVIFKAKNGTLEINYSEISTEKSFPDSVFLMNDIDFSKFKRIDEVE